MYPYPFESEAEGQGMVEYALLLALVALVVIAGLATLAGGVLDLYGQVPNPFLSTE